MADHGSDRFSRLLSEESSPSTAQAPEGPWDQDPEGPWDQDPGAQAPEGPWDQDPGPQPPEGPWPQAPEGPWDQDPGVQAPEGPWPQDPGQDPGAQPDEGPWDQDPGAQPDEGPWDQDPEGPWPQDPGQDPGAPAPEGPWDQDPGQDPGAQPDEGPWDQDPGAQPDEGPWDQDPGAPAPEGPWDQDPEGPWDQEPGAPAPEGPWAQDPGAPAPEGPWGAGVLPVGPWSVRQAAQRSTLPVRELAACLQEKRAARASRGRRPSGVWEAWGPAHIIRSRRMGPWAGWGPLRRLLPWRAALHTIESRFGVGIKAYFIFLRYLVHLNLLHSGLVLAFVLGPRALEGGASSQDYFSFNSSDSPLDFFLGTGFLARSPVFYSFYSSSSSSSSCLTSPLLYLTGVLSVLILSLIMLVRRMAVGYRRSLGKRGAVTLSLRVLGGWDFTILDPTAAALKHGFIRNDLKLYLQEQSFSLREAQRTLRQWGFLYAVRLMLNLLVLSLLGGAFALIYFSNTWSKQELRDIPQNGFWLPLLVQYLPGVTMTLVNLLLPHVFRKISSLEDYSLSTQVNATLMRSIFLKLASLGIFLFSVFNTTTGPRVPGASSTDGATVVNTTGGVVNTTGGVNTTTGNTTTGNTTTGNTTTGNTTTGQCWENQFGSEMYKLVMLDFMASILNTLVVDLPTRLLKVRCPSCWLARLSGKQRFLIPVNVLNLVYNQTVLWAGLFYCPLLPLLGTVKLVTLFYFKKFKVLRCCAPERRMFRAASSSVLFHFMLLLGLLMAAGSLGLDLWRSRLSDCGPFQGGSVLDATAVCRASLSRHVQSSLHYLGSGAFVVPFIMAEMLILSYFFMLMRANQTEMERLKQLLVMCSSDKRFLVLVLAECSAGKKSDSFNQTPTGPPHRPPPDPLTDPHRTPPGPPPDPLTDPHRTPSQTPPGPPPDPLTDPHRTLSD